MVINLYIRHWLPGLAASAVLYMGFSMHSFLSKKLIKSYLSKGFGWVCILL